MSAHQHFTDRELVLVVAGDEDIAVPASIATHLDHCSACNQYARHIARQRAQRPALPIQPAPERLRNDIAARFGQWQRASTPTPASNAIPTVTVSMHDPAARAHQSPAVSVALTAPEQHTGAWRLAAALVATLALLGTLVMLARI
jgi:hypothetical protein